MNSIIQDDFNEFINKEQLFNSSVLLFVSKGGTLLFEGFGTFDKKPNPVEDENGNIIYSGHKSILTLSMPDLVSFMPNYFDLKGYYVTITTNNETKNYFIKNSVYNSNVNAVYCDYLKEDV